MPKDFKEIQDFKTFSKKIKEFYKCKALVRVLSFIFTFVPNYTIVVYCCNLLFSHFNFDSVLYLSLQPLLSISFVLHRSIYVHPVIANTSYWFIAVPILTLCVSLSVEYFQMRIILCYQCLNFSKYLTNLYIYQGWCKIITLHGLYIVTFLYFIFMFCFIFPSLYYMPLSSSSTHFTN